MRKHNLAFDQASRRRVDENGFLHVDGSHITKTTVNPYYGREIPGWEKQGLDPEKIYYGLRDARELAKSLPYWDGLPLHMEHHVDSAENPKKLTRIGSVSAPKWNGPYVDAKLTVWDKPAIDAINDGSFRELSCSYRYEPDFTPGEFEGIPYDFVMRNIRGNHVALVEEGRAGPDVLVADAKLAGDEEKCDGWRTLENGKRVKFKDGKMVAGYVGQENGYTYTSKPMESLEPDLELLNTLLHKHKGNIEAAAKEYFKAKMQGRHVDAMADKWPIHAAFTATSWDKISDQIENDITKARLLPHIPDIITTGDYRVEEAAHNHPEYNVFHTFRKKIQMENGEREAIVDVGERVFGPPVNVVYNLTREGTRGYKRRSANAALHPGQTRNTPITPSQDSETIHEENIGRQFEIVNIRFADEEPENSRANPAHDSAPNTIGRRMLMRLKKWFRGANDSSPETEKEEVDLAQAIIDLHKIDPKTGEVEK